MNQTSSTRNLLIATSLCLAALFNTAASAQTMVSVKGSTLNMREGPGTHTAVLWELKQGYPLQITQGGQPAQRAGYAAPHRGQVGVRRIAANA